MKKVFEYLKPHYFMMLLGLLVKVTGTFADLGLPWVLSYILDDVIPKNNIIYILLWGMVMLLLAILARQLNIRANRMASRVARDTVEVIRHDLFQKVSYLSGAQVDTITAPSLISRLTSDTYNIHQVIGMMQRLGVRAPIILVGGIVLTATLDPVLTLVLVAILPLLAFVVYLVSKKGIPMYKQTQASVDHMVRVLRENITGIRIIKALSKTEYEKNRFREINEEVSDKELSAGSVMALSGPMMNLLLNVGLSLVVIVGAFRVNSGTTQPGKIVAFLSYFTMILNAMMMVTRLFIGFSKASASAARITQVLNLPEDLTTKPFVEGENPEKTAHIEFEHVSFTYSKTSEKPVLHDINFTLMPGESLGIIGATGSGKTTIINLLMRFYETTQGIIRIHGRDINSIPLKELRKNFGTVFQNDMIFADTIEENISFGRSLDKNHVEQAAIQASAMDFIKEKPNQFQFEAAIRGANFSGGQKQRLFIARALAGQPDILILDDSSSALDYKTDAQLRKTIREDYEQTTCIMIAQRISSIMQSDHILVLEDGEAIGYGSHEELMTNCEVYREIYQSQMGEKI